MRGSSQASSYRTQDWRLGRISQLIHPIWTIQTVLSLDGFKTGESNTFETIVVRPELGDAVKVAVCRLLAGFRPLAANLMVGSIWQQIYSDN
jgi:hypothetical protein